MGKTIKRLGYVFSALVLAFGAVVVPGKVHAEEACTVNEGAVDINGGTLCVMNEAVSTINFSGTVGQLGDMLYAFEHNAGYGYGTYASNSTINATISDVFSDENVTWLSGLMTSYNETVALTPAAGDYVVTNTNNSLPDGYSINYDNVVVHLPAGTSVLAALGNYMSLNNDTATVAVNDSAITVNHSDTYGIVVHLAEGTSVEDGLATVAAVGEGVDYVLASGMDYWMDVADGDVDVYALSADALTEALGLVDTVYVNYDMTVATLTIPAGKTVIEDSATLTITDLANSSIEGTFEREDTENYQIVKIGEVAGGEISFRANNETYTEAALLPVGTEVTVFVNGDDTHQDGDGFVMKNGTVITGFDGSSFTLDNEDVTLTGAVINIGSEDMVWAQRVGTSQTFTLDVEDGYTVTGVGVASEGGDATAAATLTDNGDGSYTLAANSIPSEEMQMGDDTFTRKFPNISLVFTLTDENGQDFDAHTHVLFYDYSAEDWASDDVNDVENTKAGNQTILEKYTDEIIKRMLFDGFYCDNDEDCVMTLTDGTKINFGYYLGFLWYNNFESMFRNGSDVKAILGTWELDESEYEEGEYSYYDDEEYLTIFEELRNLLGGQGTKFYSVGAYILANGMWGPQVLVDELNGYLPIGQFTDLGEALTVNADVSEIDEANPVRSGLTRHWRVARYHNGQAELLPDGAVHYDAVNHVVTYDADGFSIYAIAYEDVLDPIITPDTGVFTDFENSGNAASASMGGLMAVATLGAAVMLAGAVKFARSRK